MNVKSKVQAYKDPEGWYFYATYGNLSFSAHAPAATKAEAIKLGKERLRRHVGGQV